MKNIVLIGMPGAGKSTIGVLLAKTMLMDFCDTDLIIQKKEGSALCEIIKEKGTGEFIRIEDEIIGAQKFENCVIATGGSAVYGENAMKNLRENGIIVYLKVNSDELEKRICNIHTRGIAMKEGTTIAELYAERAPLYEKYADITVDCSHSTPEQCVDNISALLIRNA
ncbi:MAG: shikimate kinase [Clostridia bacterium]|nr:shikimate kinase [Clostridia bacterium]